jgi:transcriptional regulator with XRE-family HTH domain
VPATRRRSGATVKRPRNGRGWTQEALATKVGCALNTIARVETGTRRPPLALLKRLVRVFKVGLAHLAG